MKIRLLIVSNGETEYIIEIIVILRIMNTKHSKITLLPFIEEGKDIIANQFIKQDIFIRIRFINKICNNK